MASKNNIDYLKKQLEISTKNHYSFGIANNSDLLGDAYVSSGKYEMAIEYYKKSLEIYNEIDDLLEKIKCNFKLANSHYKLAQYHTAIEYCKKSLEISATIDEPSGVANSNCLLGNAYCRIGEYKEAIKYYEKGLEISTAIGDQSGIANNNGNLGNAYLRLGEYQKAIKYYEKGLEISTAIGDQSGIANKIGNLGNAYRNLGEYQKAIKYYEKGLEINTAIGDQSGIASNNGNLGNAYLCLGEYQKAIKYYEKGLEISSTIGDQLGIANKNGNLGNAYWNLGEYQKAIKYCEKGLEISSAIGDQLGIANHNGNLGNAYLCLGEYQKAIKYYEKGLEISSTIGNQSGIASNNGNLGNAYFSLGEYKKAIKYCEKGLEISTAIGDQSGIAYWNGNLGNAYLRLGEYQKAIKYYEKGLELSSTIGDQSEIANINGNLGNAYLSLGEYQKAIKYYEKGLEISTAIGYQSRIANTNGNLGDAYLRLGDYQKAIKYYEKGLQISTAIGDQSQIAYNNCNLGNAYCNLGEYQKAIKYYEKGLEISTAIGDQPGMVNNNSNLGNAYLRLGDYQKAIKYYENGLEISTAIGVQSQIANNNGNLGNAYLRLRDYQKAIKYYDKGLEISTAIGDQSQIADNNGNLGNAYCNLGEYQKAIQYSEKGLEISTAIGDQSGIANNNNSLGNTYRNLGEYQKAIKYYEKGLEINSAIGDQSSIAITYSNLGYAYLDSGEYGDARSHLEEAIMLFDKIFFNFVPDANKLSYTPHHFKTHRFLMSCFLSLERAKSSLLVIDLGKAKELHFCIEKYKNCAATEINDFTRTTWNRIRACEEEIEIEEIQQILQMGKKDTSILVYGFDHEGSLIVWVLNEDFVFRKVDAANKTILSLMAKLLKMVNVNVGRNSSFQENVSVVNTSNPVNCPFEILSRGPHLKDAKFDSCGQEILKELFQLLIDPVKNSLEGNKLIVVPDKQLFFTPFSSLVDENDRFLTSKYSIQITPSLHTLKASMQRENNSNFGFAMFIGNPETSLKVADLPGAAEEVEYLASLFEANPLLGREARKQVVIQLLGEASIIHIAAHAEPSRGEIVLAPDQPCLPVLNPDSYLLTQRDIQSISVQARLVVLCCCFTGRGEVSSEGVVGIARSFLAAGARSVLGTLWSIDDKATNGFMKKFYHELLEETSVCEALRRTVNLFQKHKTKEYQSIKIWAPFTVYGEDVKFKKQEIEEIKGKSHTLKASMQRANNSNFGLALFIGIGNPETSLKVADLPGATEEVKHLASLFKATPLLGREARKQVVMHLLSEASIIHIAAHAEPSRGEIMLAPDQPCLPVLNPDSYLLTQRDIHSISVQARLVVLCCYTGKGKVSSEGVVDIARSFLAAGARSVLATLWPIDDEAKKKFMEKFYDELLQETPVCEALKRAKNLFQEDEKKEYQSIRIRSLFTIYGEDVKFKKQEIEKIRKKSREYFADFVVLPAS